MDLSPWEKVALAVGTGLAALLGGLGIRKKASPVGTGVLHAAVEGLERRLTAQEERTERRAEASAVRSDERAQAFAEKMDEHITEDRKAHEAIGRTEEGLRRVEAEVLRLRNAFHDEYRAGISRVANELGRLDERVESIEERTGVRRPKRDRGQG